MAAEETQLIVSIEGRINQLEKSMARAAKVSGDTYSGMEKRARDAAKNIDKSFANDNMKGLAEGAKLSTVQFAILKAAATDAFGGLAAGQSAMTVLMQQSGQIASAIGEDGVMGLVKGIGGGLGRLVSPATAAMAAIVAVGAAGAYSLSRYRQEQLAIELSLTGIGALSGATAADVRRVGDEAAASGKISAAAAREVATALAATGKIKAADLSDITRLTPGFSKIFGLDGAKAAAQLAGIFSDPAKGADELDSRLGMLDDKTRQYIRTLAEQGNRQAAIRTLIAAVSPQLEEVAQKTSIWAKACNSVANAADTASNAVGKAMAAPTLDEKLAAARSRRDSARNGPEDDYVRELKKAKLTDAQIKAIVPTYAPNTDALDAEVAKLEADAEAQRKLNREKEEALRIKNASKAAGDLIRVFNDEAEAADKLANQYTNLKSILDDPAVVDKLDGGAEKATATLQALRERVKLVSDDLSKGGTVAGNALRQADFAKNTAGLSAYAKGLAEINAKFDEMARAAKLAGDAGTQATRLQNIEAARTTSIGAYNTENAQRARASVGLPDGFTAATIAAESSGNDSAKNPRSSATGAGQFISSTWLSLFKEIYSEMAATLSDDAILALRTNRTYSARLIEEYARKNAIALQNAGFDGTDRNLHLAHFLGSGGAISMLKASPSANAASVLPAAAKANPEVFKSGAATVQDILDYASRRGQRSGASGRGQEDATRRLQAEKEAYSKTTEEAERLKSIEEQISADREKNGDISQRFKNAQDLIKASSAELTPELRAQREEILKLADARAKAAGDNVRTRFDEDIRRARESLGRTSGEQSDVDRVRGLGADPNSSTGKEMAGQLSQLRTMQELRSAASGFATGFASDIMRGTTALQALQNQLTRVADKLMNMVIDNLVTKAFGALLGGGTGGTGGGGGIFSGLTKLLGFSDGGYTGDGGKYQPAGIVHAGEFVIPKEIVDRIGIPALERLRRGYANGGLVGGLPSFASAMPAGMTAMGAAPVISPTFNVQVQGSAGSDAKGHAETGENIAKALENQMRSIVSEELRRSRRPGGIFDKS